MQSSRIQTRQSKTFKKIGGPSLPQDSNEKEGWVVQRSVMTFVHKNEAEKLTAIFKRSDGRGDHSQREVHYGSSFLHCNGFFIS